MPIRTTYRRDLEPTKTPSCLDIAWAAGIYEGEGSCVRGGNGKRSFVASVPQKDPEILYRLRDMFGGSVKEYANTGTNVCSGPVTIHAWRICGDRCRIFLAVIYSYLTARRKAQIDATPVRVFLDLVGEVPVDGGLGVVTARLMDHICEEKIARKQRRKDYQKQFYENSKASDPEFMNKRREQVAASRRKAKVVAIA